jgi:hypothetical protein
MNWVRFNQEFVRLYVRINRATPPWWMKSQRSTMTLGHASTRSQSIHTCLIEVVDANLDRHRRCLRFCLRLLVDQPYTWWRTSWHAKPGTADHGLVHAQTSAWNVWNGCVHTQSWPCHPKNLFRAISLLHACLATTWVSGLRDCYPHAGTRSCLITGGRCERLYELTSPTWGAATHCLGPFSWASRLLIGHTTTR